MKLKIEGSANRFSGLEPWPTLGSDRDLLALPFLFCGARHGGHKRRRT
jgi:hypothetical protein